MGRRCAPNTRFPVFQVSRIILQIHRAGSAVIDVIPSHRISIETLQGGANVSDEQYIRAPTNSWRRRITTWALSTRSRKGHVKAAAMYERALDLDPHFPAACC